MVCYTSCILSVAFITAMMFIIFNVESVELKKNFMKLLDKKQIEIYENIIKERQKIYIQGYIIGLIVAILLLLLLKSKNLNGKNTFYVITFVFSVVFIINYFYYILTPKSTYMIEHIQKPEQIEAWLKIYRSMQFKYHLGFFVGLIAIIFISRAYLSF